MKQLIHFWIQERSLVKKSISGGVESKIKKEAISSDFPSLKKRGTTAKHDPRIGSGFTAHNKAFRYGGGGGEKGGGGH